MKAVIVTGGKQYTVAEGDVIYVEKLGVEAENTVTFDQVLAVVNGKGKKIVVFKYRPKKDSKSIRGHRQPYTKVEITKIAL